MALGVTSFDEINKLVGMKRSEPFDDYFAPMKISAEQKRERIRLAEKFQEEFVYMLAYMFYAYPEVNVEMVNELRDRYITTLETMGIAYAIASSDADKEIALRMQATKFANDTVDVTHRHKDDPYYYSEDRARLMAEDQSNFVMDISDFADAIAQGYRYKTWQTVGDNRVRNSHEEVDGLTLPIEEPFQLQGGLMMQPHDMSMGVSEDEVIMCRCSLAFSR